MVAPYDLRSQPDLDDSSYARLPGSGGEDLVPQNMTSMKSKAPIGHPGCHPTRWIYEVLNNNFTVCDMYVRADKADLDAPFDWHHEHRLVFNGNQSYTTKRSKVLSSICLDCHFHFVFKMSWEESCSPGLCRPAQATWPMRESSFPWHHLVWTGSEPDAQVQQEHTKFCPLRAREHFVCVCSPCTFQVTLEVSDPRLGTKDIGLLQDEEAIRRELQLAIEKDPERYESATAAWATQATMNLNTYLKNILESDNDSMRSISKRNKRFAVVFGPRCFELFRKLGFQETVDINDEGVDEGNFTPVAPPAAQNNEGCTDIGNYRAYIEDVRSEVQALIHKIGQVGEPPSFINSVLHADFDCPKLTGIRDNPLVNVERYTLLGVLPTQSAEIIVNAYFRQWHLLPNKRRELIEGLMNIANDSGDERLTNFAITQSSVFESQLKVQGNTDDDGLVNQALLFLDLSPPNTYPADDIVKAFRKKLTEKPTEAGTARAMLELIAQSSDNPEYQTTLLMEQSEKMTLPTAEVVLGASLAGGSAAVDNFVTKLEEKVRSIPERAGQVFYFQAADVIAESSGIEAAFSEILRLRKQYIWQAEQQPTLMESEGTVGEKGLPVGLNNIGNTCYLNSLLQYLYTVKAVRDVVTNYHAYRLDLDDDSVQKRRLGGNKMEMDRAEAVVAQAFVKELAELFDRLHTSDKVATRPSQRLANAVLLSTRSLVEEASKAEAEQPSSDNPPPLPARPSSALQPLSTPPADASVDQPYSTAVVAESEISSRGSSETLIDMNDDRRLEHGAIQGSTDLTAEKGPVKLAADSESTLPLINGNDADTVMTEAVEAPPTIDEKVLKALEHQKRSSGTDQQDVEEVIGSIINLLQQAIRPSHTDATTGIQFEKIIETFFVTTINYTKKFDEKSYQHEISYDRSITAFPAPDGPCSLYDALGRNFDQQVLEDSKLSRYTAIKTLPPILHVLIQRTQSTGRKNDNPVVISDTLYLDRYMDAPHDSPEFKRRMEDWVTSNRLDNVKKCKIEADAFTGSGALIEKIGASSKQGSAGKDTVLHDIPKIADTFQEEDWSFDGPVDEEFLMVVNDSAGEPSLIETEKVELGAPGGFDAAEKAVLQMIDNEIKEREQKLEQHFSASLEVAYRLEAVICHRGVLNAGHYWVWIHDFEAGVWRCYNDDKVTVKQDTEEVLKELSNGGEPYYLCYVRDSDKQDLVSVPPRELEELPALVSSTDTNSSEPEISVADIGESITPESQGTMTMDSPDNDAVLLKTPEDLGEPIVQASNHEREHETITKSKPEAYGSEGQQSSQPGPMETD